MPRAWRTVHRSAHKIVMVKPRDRHHSATSRNNTSGGTDLSWLWPVVQVILAVFMLIFVVELLIAAWPFILIGAIIFLIIAG